MADRSPTKPPDRRTATPPNAITVRGSAERKGRLEDFAARLRSKPTAVIDLGWAKPAAQGRFSEPPPPMPS